MPALTLEQIAGQLALAVDRVMSEGSLYDRELSSMDVEGGYDQEDARGFIRINALRLKAHQLILERTAEGGDGPEGDAG